MANSEKRAKRILGISYDIDTGSLKAQENLELMMLYASFGFDVSLVLMDKAVISAQVDQDLQLINRKNISALYAALELYDLENFFIEQEALNKYQITVSDKINYQPFDKGMLKSLINQADEVLVL